MVTATDELKMAVYPMNSDGTGSLMIQMTLRDRKLSFKATGVWDVAASDGPSIRACPRPEHPAQVQAILDIFIGGL